MRLFTLAVVGFLAFASGAAAQDEARERAFAERGFVATRSDPVIKAADGRTVWDLNAWRFLDAEPAADANPLTWRHGRLLAKHGLFQVSERIWQVRGFDGANATFIKGQRGWIVIDPLTVTETAAAALALVNERLGARPVSALIYTHSHIDHFGGARGMVSQAELDAGRVQVIAPEGFLEHAVAENLLAGPAMRRRAGYQFGSTLPASAQGRIGIGIGQGIAAGTQSLIPPTRTITRTGETVTVDGVRMVFQLTPGTEAPAEFNIYLPDDRALCLAENANATLHNILTPRGALVRDAKVWADGLAESRRLYAGVSDVMFTSHAWPRWGREEIASFLQKHADAYRYLHDQSVRLINQGYVGAEIAERVALPPVLANEWYNRGFYGDPRFTARAVYQRYMGWYDANPASLDALPPAEASARYVAAMGGGARVLEQGRAAVAAGDLRWAAELLARLVQAEPANAAAKTELAAVFTRLGTGAESAIWRNIYLTGAKELRDGPPRAFPGGAGAPDLIRNTPTDMLLDLLAVRLDGPRAAAGAPFSIELSFPERKERHRLEVRNGVLAHEPSTGAPADLTVALPRPAFLALTAGQGALPAFVQGGTATATGDVALMARLTTLLDQPAGDFSIVTRP